MSPFDYKDYRLFLKALCRQPEAKRGFQAALAKAAGCQSSYLSQVLQGNVHVTKDSAWQPAMQMGRRQLALRSIVLNPTEAIHFSSVFTIGKTEIDELKNIIKSFLEKTHKVIQKSDPEELHCMCLDCFLVI